MDAAGKDSTIEHVMSGVNPQGVQVVSFKQPSSEELDHTFLWRISKSAPGTGPDRDLQPLALRGGRRPAGPPGVARQAKRLPTATAGRASGRALRRPQRVRAAPRPQRHEGRQVLPPRLQGRAEAAVHGAPRQPGQAVEVQRRRRRRARALGRVHGRPTRMRSRPRRPSGRRGTCSQPTTST